MRARPRPITSDVAPSQYEPGMQLLSSTFSGSLFQILSDDHKKRSLAISNSQILEVIESSSSNGIHHIMNIHQLQSLAKVQIQKDKICIVFQFRSGLSKSYSTTDSVACLECVKKEMKSSGFEAHHWSPVIEQQVSTGYDLLDTVHQLEEQFSLAPSLQLLESMMALTREAVECLGQAQDERHVKALRRMQSILSRADVVELLDRNKEAMKEGTCPYDEGVSLEHKIHEGDDATRHLPVITGEGFATLVGGNTSTKVSGCVSEDIEDLRLERELYELIGVLDEELKTIL